MWSVLDMPKTVQQCGALNQTVNCTQPAFGQFEANPDVAGAGVLLSFKIALGVTLGIAFALLVYEAVIYCFGDVGRNMFAKKLQREKQDQWRHLFDDFLVSLSDQQIVTGIALSAVTLNGQYGMACSLSAYHYDLVCDLVVMASVVHLCSMLALDRYFHVWWLGVLRVALILLSFGLGARLLVNRAEQGFPGGVPSNSGASNNTMLVVPAVCFMSGNTTDDALSKASDGTFYSPFAEYMCLVAGCAVALALSGAQSYLKSDNYLQNNSRAFESNRWVYFGRLVFFIFSLIASAFAWSQLDTLYYWMQGSGWMSGDDETNWQSIGQLLPLIMLILPVFALLEALADKLDSREKRQKREGRSDYEK